MIPRSNHHPADPADQDEPLDPRLLTDLQAAYRRSPPLAAVDGTIRRAVAARVARQDAPTHRMRQRRWLHRLSVPVAALVMLTLGLGTYLHLQSPSPVSAQTVLQRAAAVRPGPNQATHAIYRLTGSGGITGTADVWVGTDAQGAPSEFALTVTGTKDGQPAPEKSGQSVLTGRTLKEYDPARNTVTVYPQGALDQSAQLQQRFVGALAAQKVSRMLADQHQTAAPAQQQTLDGVSVYAVSVQGAGETFYFNAQSYILEGMDWTSDGKPAQARLDPASYQTMPLSAVPPQAFTLTAPPNARVDTISPSADQAKGGAVHVKLSGDDPIVTAAAAACHTTKSAFQAAVQAGDKSMLAICQETAPSMTAEQLVTALLVPVKASLDAEVAAGALTRTQEADELAGVQRKLLMMVTAQPGSPPKQPIVTPGSGIETTSTHPR
jgi:hypothetical protein